MSIPRNGNLKIVKIKGGIGNQLFQYAFGRMLCERYGFDIKYDLHQFNTHFNEINNYKLDSFNTKIDIASPDELRRCCKVALSGNPHTRKYRLKIIANKLLSPSKYYFERTRIKVDVDSITKYEYFDGYWQSEDYFLDIRPEILDEITLKNMSENTRDTIKMITEQNAVFIGIRRPYSFESSQMKKNLNGVSSNCIYYEKAMEYICKRVENPVFYVFSNDISWVKQNIHFPAEVHYRTKEVQSSDEEELMIMASCKHGILSNSTFNWWGAWLINNPEKIVIVPEYWADKKTSIIPKSWVSYKEMMRG